MLPKAFVSATMDDDRRRGLMWAVVGTTLAVMNLCLMKRSRSARSSTDEDYWTAFQAIASEDFGFMRSPALPPSTPVSPVSDIIIKLAGDIPSVFADNDSKALRKYIDFELRRVGTDNEDTLRGLPQKEKETVFAALVYIRHAYHQGDPTAPAVQNADFEGKEPGVLTRACASLGHDLGIRPFLNLAVWVLLNWTANEDDSEDLQMRFQWFRGAAGETELHFWQAFAMSERRAVPMYGIIGELFGALNSNRRRVMTRCLDDIAETLTGLISLFRTKVTTEAIGINDFNKLQNVAHFGMASAGAGGFQLPFIVVLDALLFAHDGRNRRHGGGDCPFFSAKLEEVRALNLDEVPNPIKEFALKFVAPRARELRDAAAAFADVGESYDKVVSAFVHWRSLHRSRAAKWLTPSLVTTGRSNEDMGGCVLRSFLADMDEIIQVTRAQRVSSRP